MSFTKIASARLKYTSELQHCQQQCPGWTGLSKTAHYLKEKTNEKKNCSFLKETKTNEQMEYGCHQESLLLKTERCKLIWWPGMTLTLGPSLSTIKVVASLTQHLAADLKEYVLLWHVALAFGRLRQPAWQNSPAVSFIQIDKHISTGVTDVAGLQLVPVPERWRFIFMLVWNSLFSSI